VTTWYTRLASYEDVNEAARALAGNWRKFESFGWHGRPTHRPEDCAIVYLENRDSDCLDQSNAAAIYAALHAWTGLQCDGSDVETQSHNHWAVGHVDGIVIRCLDAKGKATAAFKALHALAAKLDGYPVLDEDDFSRREQEAADLTWKSCYREAERIEYIRQHREQFEFHGLADMAACVRGKFFAGYASELLG